MAKLQILSGNKIGQSFPLPNGPVTIGSAGSNTIILPDESVENQHAMLIVEGDHCRLRDRTKTNQLFVNGEAYKAVDLHFGDIIRIGDVEIRFLEGGRAPAHAQRRAAQSGAGAEHAPAPAPAPSRPAAKKKVTGPRFEDIYSEYDQKRKKVVEIEIPLFEILTWGGIGLFLIICVYVYWPRKVSTYDPRAGLPPVPTVLVDTGPPPPLGFLKNDQPPSLPYEVKFGPAPASKGSGAVLYSSQYGSAQAALDAAKPGTAIVFDAPRPERIHVTNPIEDLQFIGGGAEWLIETNMVDCQFFWHTPISFVQNGGKVERCAFYKSHSSAMSLNNSDAVSLYYSGMKVNPASSQPQPHIQLHGSVRAVTIFKPVISDGNPDPDWSMQYPPFVSIYATDLEAHGHNTYFISPMTIGQTAWTPFHIVRGTGVTYAHGVTVDNVWANPVMDIDYGIDCAVIATALGGKQGAGNAGYFRQPDKLRYYSQVDWGHNHVNAPFRGAAFRIGGQRNKLIGLGNLQNWSVGLRATLPGLHYADGVLAKDPYFQEWSAETAGLSVNLAEPATVFKLDWSMRSTPNAMNSTTNTRTKYPLLGPNIAQPVFVPLKDLRAMPPDFNSEPLEDLTGKPVNQIQQALDAGKVVYLGPGTYSFGQPVTNGMVFGAGMEKTILEWPKGVDCINRDCKGMVNLTLKGGRFGYNSQSGSSGDKHTANALFLRTRFDGQAESAINFHAVEDQVYQDCEFINVRNGITQGRLKGRGYWIGQRGTSAGRRVLRLNIVNCLFKNIRERAIDLTMIEPESGVVAIHNCVFETVKLQGIKLIGGKSHLLQNCRFNQVGPIGYQVPVVEVSGRGVVVLSHLQIDNRNESGSGTALLVDGIATVSHCQITGCATALTSRYPIIVDNTVSKDGGLALPYGSLVFKSTFRNADVAKGAMEVQDIDKFKSITLESAVQELDTTPPPEVKDLIATRVNTGNLIRWAPVSDRESGINQYIIYAKGEEISRTPLTSKVKDVGHNPLAPPVLVSHFIDPDVRNSGYTIKAINGANLLSGGTQAPLFGWGPLQATFKEKDGGEIQVENIEYQRSLQLSISSSSGRKYSPHQLEDNGLPSKVELLPGPRLEKSQPFSTNSTSRATSN